MQPRFVTGSGSEGSVAASESDMMILTGPGVFFWDLERGLTRFCFLADALGAIGETPNYGGSGVNVARVKSDLSIRD